MSVKCLKFLVALLIASLLMPTFSISEDIKKERLGTLVVDKEYKVSGTEKWDDIKVTSNGKLIIPMNSILKAKVIDCSGGEIHIIGGIVDISSDNMGEKIGITGTLNILNVSKNARIYLDAPNGGNSTSNSTGVDALMHLRVSLWTRISNSVIIMNGGSGYTNDEPWTTEDLSGYVSAGGNGTFKIESDYGDVFIENSTFNIMGGSGGDAADGCPGTGDTGGRGGGYTNGGNVSGYVGAGGKGEFVIICNNLTLKGANITLNGGYGGDAGDAGDGGGNGGGGGGGYCGGDGGNSRNNGKGGKVSGYVGKGGNAELILSAENYTIKNVAIVCDGGNGGNGGKGGDADRYAAGGGGGYGGGGGGGYYSKGASAFVSGNVGAGGDVIITIEAKNNGYMEDIFLMGTGGNGGHGGNGGNGGFFSGGGGGGYGGAGGSSYYRNDGASAQVSGYVGSGGNVTVNIYGGKTITSDCTFLIFGGNGGEGGNGGDSGRYGGGGGGGYGGGGGGAYYTGNGGSWQIYGHVGAGGTSKFNVEMINKGHLSFRQNLVNVYGGVGGSAGIGGKQNGYGGGGGGGYGGGGGGAYWRGNGGSGGVPDGIGDGGDAILMFVWQAPTITIENNFDVNGGQGGNGDTSKGGGDRGGAGTGRKTKQGNSTIDIPMSVPEILTPSNGSIANAVPPTFTWTQVYPSTNDGEVSYYVLQIDREDSFSSKVVDVSLYSELNFTPTSELTGGGKFYCRIKAMYFTENFADWSEVYVFYFNTPPVLTKRITVVSFDEDTVSEHLIDLNEYFTDDVFPENLTYEIVYESDPSKIAGIVDEHYLTFISPTKDWNGRQRFRVRATDPLGLSMESNTFTVRVRPVNDPPRIAPIPDIHLTEDTEYIFDISPYLHDVDNRIEELKLTTNSSYVIIEDKILRMLYPEGVENDVIYITVSDRMDASATSTINVTVTRYNDPPITKKIERIVINEDLNKVLPLDPFVSDEEDTISDLIWNVVHVDSVPSNLLVAEIDNERNLQIGPYPDMYGRAVITLSVSDSGGKTSYCTVEVIVNAVNDPPVISPLPYIEVVAGNQITVNMSEYIYDVDSPKESLTISTTSDYATVVGNNIVISIPDDFPTGKNETDVRVTVSDGDEVSQRTFTVHILFPPEIEDIHPIKMKTDKKYILDLKEYLYDPDDEIETLECSVEALYGNSAEAYIDPTTKEVIIDPKKEGKTEFLVKVHDGHGGFAEKTFIVSVFKAEEKIVLPTAFYVIVAFIGVAAILSILLFFMRKNE